METITLDSALDIVETLSLDDQEVLIEVLRRRRIERWRDELARDARQALEDFHAGKLKAETVEEIMRAARS